MSDFVIGLLVGVVFLVLYTLWIINAAATIAINRIERQFAEMVNENADDDDDTIDRLDRMWGKRDDA